MLNEEYACCFNEHVMLTFLSIIWHNNNNINNNNNNNNNNNKI